MWKNRRNSNVELFRAQSAAQAGVAGKTAILAAWLHGDFAPKRAYFMARPLQRRAPWRAAASSKRLSMVRVTSTIALLLGCVLASTAAAQVLTFARDDYPSDVGARGIVSADFNRDGWLDVAHANSGRNSVAILLNHGGSS